MMHRCANVTDLGNINTLIRESKGFWGYSDSFLDEFMQQWGIKESYLHTNEVILLEVESNLMGLYAFKINNQQAPELDVFFVARNKIGTGVGKSMWQQALHYAFVHQWAEFEIIADPNAEQFYERMGAKTVGTFESFPGRFVPVMMMKLNNMSSA